MESSFKLILAACLFFQLAINIAWSYKENIVGLFKAKEEAKCWDLAAYSLEINHRAKYIDLLIGIRDQIKELDAKFYFSEREAKNFDDEVRYQTAKLHEEIGKESLMPKRKEANCEHIIRQ